MFETLDLSSTKSPESKKNYSIDDLSRVRNKLLPEITRLGVKESASRPYYSFGNAFGDFGEFGDYERGLYPQVLALITEAMDWLKENPGKFWEDYVEAQKNILSKNISVATSDSKGYYEELKSERELQFSLILENMKNSSDTWIASSIRRRRYF